MRAARIAVALAVVFVAAQAVSAADEERGRPNLFQRLDADKDGKITEAEIPKDAPERLKELLRKADQDNDRVVTGEEMTAAARQFRQRAEAPAKQGREDSGERRARLDKLFSHLDKNGDQMLSKEEFKAALERWHRARGDAHHRYHGDAHHRHQGHDKDQCHDRHGRHDKHKASDKRRGHDKDGDHAEKDDRGSQGCDERDRRRPHDSAERGKRMKERFQAADKNEDGKLSREETAGPLQEHFDKIDADGDGQLTPDEIKKAFQKWHKAAGAKQAKEAEQEETSSEK